MLTQSKFQLLARAGYTARATVFFLVGGLALFSGIAGGKSDTKSALDSLLEQPFGQVWVGLIAAGLIGFVVWRLAQSIGNADTHNHDAKGTAIRISLLGSALAYIGLAYYAIDRVAGLGGEGDGGDEKGLTEWIISTRGTVARRRHWDRLYYRWHRDDRQGRVASLREVAIGLASFGAYNVIQARYRIVRAPSVTREINNAAKICS